MFFKVIFLEINVFIIFLFDRLLKFLLFVSKVLGL